MFHITWDPPRFNGDQQRSRDASSSQRGTHVHFVRPLQLSLLWRPSHSPRTHRQHPSALHSPTRIPTCMKLAGLATDSLPRSIAQNSTQPSTRQSLPVLCCWILKRFLTSPSRAVNRSRAQRCAAVLSVAFLHSAIPRPLNASFPWDHEYHHETRLSRQASNLHI